MSRRATDTCYQLFSAPRDPTQTWMRVTGSFSGRGDSPATGAMDMFVTPDGLRWERWVQLPHLTTLEYKYLMKWGDEARQGCALTGGATWDCAGRAANMQLPVDCTVCP